MDLLTRTSHIAITVDDLDAACQRFEELNVNWKKRLTDGRMKNIAFVLGLSPMLDLSTLTSLF
jgi:hypothetical protein